MYVNYFKNYMNYYLFLLNQYSLSVSLLYSFSLYSYFWLFFILNPTYPKKGISSSSF